ncbi:MAG: hypothetical protein ACRELC_08090, partial [Gemmatimonadota bacterium]
MGRGCGARRALRLAVPTLLLLSLLTPPAAARAQQRGAPDSTDRQASDLDAVVTPTAGSAGHMPLAPRTSAVRLDTASRIELDGRLDEAAWAEAPAATRFVQREPDEGLPATQRTDVRFVYDGETLYVGARMYDELGEDGVTSRLVRRDAGTQSDELILTFDTFHDHLGTSQFRINPAGVRGDAFSDDDSWDPVWRADARVDS